MREVIVNSGGVDLYVREHGAGDAVVLLHGWPDSSALWRNQVPALTANGLRVITPDLRGFGQSSRPQDKDLYKLSASVGDVAAVLDTLGVETAHIVGHDWGAAVAWLVPAFLPHRVRTLTVLSVPHPLVPPTRRQREMAWYQLFFQFEGIAEESLRHEDWAMFRDWAAGYKDIDRAIEDLSRPGALTASLNWYRANLAPRMPGPPPRIPPVTVPTLGIWSDGDRYLDGARVQASGAYVSGPWRYEEIPGATHWIPLDAPDSLNEMLLGWLLT
jgi:pimeloyl-ACP methyl ester carboxylesterase